MKYGLSETTIDKINSVFAEFSEITQVILYGSRAMGNYKPGSDIDLTLHGAGLNAGLRNVIAEQLDELLLPYMIDLSIFSELKHPELESHIERVGVVFYEQGS